ncbi:MAG: protoporphyrinogen oxidase [Acidobacteria bacterium]|nr:protoporphyrinogen oxidase [Acidobacteriota bacterium]MBW4044949.1 protoporphyrinogen oxidase [Acidobacteriota bacterium]
MSGRIAVIGGGISGVAAAYELALQGREFVLYEASARLGGIVETVHHEGFVVECGPDSWVTEKPWARELAIELGLEDEIISSNDTARLTYLVRGNTLAAMPEGMRMMVPAKWEPLLSSPLFSWQAKLAYLREPRRAEELKAAALADSADESIADFVRRHFGDEVTDTLAAPLLAGIFGGDIAKLSARAVMAGFVKMEREQGSLISAVQSRASAPQASVFTTLKGGLQRLIDGMAATLPAMSVRLGEAVSGIERRGAGWQVAGLSGEESFDAIIIATPPHITKKLLKPVDARMASLVEMDATSAVVVALAFAPENAQKLRIPRGFGFLEPVTGKPNGDGEPALLACTFVHQKFSHRAPDGGVLLRGFYGGEAAGAMAGLSDDQIAATAHRRLSRLLGPLPTPDFSLVRHWPLSLPQYGVGHLERMAELASLERAQQGLRLVGNAYHGVGLPELVRQGRDSARSLTR